MPTNPFPSRRQSPGLSILTNDDGSGGGELAFFGKGHVTFTKLAGKLSINDTPYTLENSITGLAAAIQKNPSGAYAMAAGYDASRDGTYSKSPISPGLAGTFEGLGNVISNLAIVVPEETSGEDTALFALLSGTIRDFGVVHANISIIQVKYHREFTTPTAGLLVGDNLGTIARVHVRWTLV